MFDLSRFRFSLLAGNGRRLRRPPKADLRKQIVGRSAEGMRPTPLQASPVAQNAEGILRNGFGLCVRGDGRSRYCRPITKLNMKMKLASSLVAQP